MLLIHQVRVELDKDVTDIKQILASKLNAAIDDIESVQIVKESLDARKTPYYSYSVIATIKNEKKYLKHTDVSFYAPKNYSFTKVQEQKVINVVGFGPSGMLASYLLAKANLKPVIFERGSMVDKRANDVSAFWNNGTLDSESNVQFGEGGAGTFSDGKLTTRIKDDRISTIIDLLVQMGAPERIRFESHPHIGTDILRTMVKNFRQSIIEMGGTFHFDTKVDALITQDNQVIGVRCGNQDYKANQTILAIGHSAHDTLEVLREANVEMQIKDFAIGVRVEHPQLLINKNQYKQHYQLLPPSEYRLTYHTQSNRGVYSFCMCPGGYVVASSSEPFTICTNGMSMSTRSGEIANAAILVQISQKDYYHQDLFDGLNYQKNIEKKAFELTGSYVAPCSNIKDFIEGKLSPLQFESTYKPGTKVVEFRSLFSETVVSALIEAFKDFDRKIPGFIQHGIMVGPETRSSSIVRIVRDNDFQSLSHRNLYPIGEGAGYAGGIMSSALDGFKVAEAIIKQFT